MSFLGGNMSKNGVERVLNRLKMAGHLMVATIGSPGTVSSGPTSFWPRPELDSFCKWVKMSFFGGNMSKNGWKGF